MSVGANRLSLRLIIPWIVLLGGLVTSIGLFAVSYIRGARQIERRIEADAEFLCEFMAGQIERNFRQNRPAQSRHVFQQASSKKDLRLAMLLNDQSVVEFATRYALVGEPIGNTPMGPYVDRIEASRHARQTTIDRLTDRGTLLAIRKVKLGLSGGELIPSRIGLLLGEADVEQAMNRLRAGDPRGSAPDPDLPLDCPADAMAFRAPPARTDGQGAADRNADGRRDSAPVDARRNDPAWRGHCRHVPPDR